MLNADDRTTQMAAGRAKSRVYWFSGTKVVRQGAFVRDGVICWIEKEGAERRSRFCLWPRLD